MFVIRLASSINKMLSLNCNGPKMYLVLPEEQVG